MKLKMMFILLILTFLLTSCSINNKAKADDGRFKDISSNPDGIEDTLTGCQYIKSGGYTSWTYVHGSCPDVIAKENGAKEVGQWN
jgi:hypothetical protein